jgi:hypothetical protein
MKTQIPLIAIAMLMLATPGHGTPPFEQARSLAFLQARGGILVEQSFRKNNRWWLAVECNVSGIKAITVTPTTIHSGLAWSKSIASIDGDRIYLQVFTAVQGTQAPSANCGPAALQRVEAQSYQVYYLDPDDSRHHLGQVEIK